METDPGVTSDQRVIGEASIVRGVAYDHGFGARNGIRAGGLVPMNLRRIQPKPCFDPKPLFVGTRD